MVVKVAETAGFCYGVSRAVQLVNATVSSGTGSKIYTYGPIVHNETVVEDLKNKGVNILSSPEELRKESDAGLTDQATVIIRAHGIGNSERKQLESIPNVTLVDATCPYVQKIHTIVREKKEAGDLLIITGNPDHPEVQGINDCIGNTAIILNSIEDAEAFLPDPERKYWVVSQTTFNARKFQDIVDILKKKMYDIGIVNTICNATQRRQSEAAALSRECDAMIVIGGKNSSNTAKLYDICRSECKATYYIQCLDDLCQVTIENSVRCIGITAGASTPKTIIEEVLNYVRTEF